MKFVALLFAGALSQPAQLGRRNLRGPFKNRVPDQISNGKYLNSGADPSYYAPAPVVAAQLNSEADPSYYAPVALNTGNDPSYYAHAPVVAAQLNAEADPSYYYFVPRFDPDDTESSNNIESSTNIYDAFKDSDEYDLFNQMLNNIGKF
ncbi:hypothetical protein CONCODRAFT_5473 [Conidiobolus coronatus NRRL 28638]|uniref:Uncharacterized protein n=1 Tax=Conidiobolus coronatus (strain ATCC 28846 / CBS 209.66 / NRRL 28638) TaxID=796925 RepID=A0A137P9X9_CONC2|nr:hypothetical protein CONCODRAFT_5473 [Conidiobolus coronatus NRRL 28638]|eukprot:KXN71764.1 hypothetical protein CONCODRAFT_5473 [Conidiobolus coronatus NRRL 28638]